MGQVLFDCLTGRTLRLYPDAALRAQALSTVAIESPRGFRIAKERATAKIDGIVALAMACCAVLDAAAPPVTLVFMAGGQNLFAPRRPAEPVDLSDTEETSDDDLVAMRAGRWPAW